jgi:hypothetical protein
MRIPLCLVIAALGCGGSGGGGAASGDDFPQQCTNLPGSNVYDSCTPVGSDTPGCLGSNEIAADPGNETTRYPVGCMITYPKCDPAYGVPYNCECQQDGSAADWWCPI